MARLPYPDPQRLPEDVRAAMARFPALNVFRMLAHAEANFAPFAEFAVSVLARQQLDLRTRELAVLETVRASGAEYAWVQHVAIGRAAGITDEQIAALERRELDAPCFDAKERAVVRFAREVALDVRASDEALAAVREHFPVREVAELTLAIAYFAMIARFLVTTGVDLDPPVDGGAIRDLR